MTRAAATPAPQRPLKSTRYDIPGALRQEGIDIGRWKGEQRGSLRKERGGWYGRWREFIVADDGTVKWSQVKRKLCGADRSRAEAIEILHEQLVMANGPAACPQGVATLHQFVEVRFRPDHVQHLKASGQDHYAYCLDSHILPALGGFRLREFQGPHIIQGFLTAKARAGLSSQTITHLRNALSAVFRHAKACGYWRGDLPTEYLRMPKAAAPIKTRVLSADQVIALLPQLTEPYRTLVHLISVTGLRIGEAVALDWAHVNIEDTPRQLGGESLPGRTIAVRRNYTHGAWGSVKSRNGERNIPLSDELVAALRRLCVPGQGWLVFANRYGQPLDAHNIGNRHLRPACRRIGMEPIGWHVLRHTAITLMRQGGMDEAEAKLIAGHGSERMTSLYTHGVLERARGTMNGIKLATEVVQ